MAWRQRELAERSSHGRSVEQPDFHVAVGAGAVWKVNDTHSVTKIDPRTDRIIRTLRLGARNPCGIAATATTVWVAIGDAACDTIGQ